MKSKKLLVFIVFVIMIIPSYVTAEGALQEWVRLYSTGSPGFATSVDVDASGNVYVAGFENGPWWAPGEGGYTTLKYNANGGLLWAKKYITGGYFDVFGDPKVKVDSLGNAYVIGRYGTIKYDSGGNEVWVKSAGATGAIDSYGNVYIVGGNGTIKYDSNGNELWVRIGGSAIALDSSGNAYITGGSGTIKYDSNGSELWVRDAGSSIALDSSGNVYVIGGSGIIKYDTDGTQAWVRSGSGYMAVDHYSGNVYTTRGENNAFVTTKYDTNGNESWVKVFMGGGYPWAIAVDNAGSVYVTGDGYINTTQSDTVKYDTNGNESWSKTYLWIREGHTRTSAIALNASGSVYVAGYAADGWGGYRNLTIKYRQDTQGPTITINEQQAMWPPNGKITNIPLTGTITDSSGVATASYTIADEYGELSLSGNISLATDGSFYLNLPLEADRRGNDSDGRLYTIHITAMDRIGNVSSKSTTVTVLHDQGSK